MELTNRKMHTLLSAAFQLQALLQEVHDFLAMIHEDVAVLGRIEVKVYIGL
jgi:hypothetical protein